MSKVGFGKIIEKSFSRSVLILFKPFDPKKWLKLMFIAYLAGCLGFGGSSGGNKMPGSRPRQSEASSRQEVLGLDAERSVAVEVADVEQKLFGEEEDVHNLRKAFSFLPDWFFNNLTLIIFLFFAVSILITWISSRFQFIWYDAVLGNDPRIKKPFEQYRDQGNSLFKLYLVVFFAGVFLLVALGYWIWTIISPVDAQMDSPGSALRIFSIIFVPVIIFILSTIVSAVFFFFVQHFVVPIMAKEPCLFKDGWGRFAQIFKENISGFFIFLLISIGFGIVGGLATMLISLIIMFALALVGLLVFGFAFLLLAVLFKVKFLFWIFAFVLGIPFLAVSIVILTAMIRTTTMSSNKVKPCREQTHFFNTPSLKFTISNLLLIIIY